MVSRVTAGSLVEPFDGRSHSRRRRSQRVDRRFPLLLVALLVATPCGGIASEKVTWTDVAKQDMAFARGLADEELRFSPWWLEQLVKDRVAHCQPRPRKMVGLSPPRIRQLRLYCDDYCEAWGDTWASAFQPCDRDLLAPTWCKAGRVDLLADHLNFEQYIAFVTESLRVKGDALERYNEMAVLADRVGYERLMDLATQRVDGPLAKAVSTFLEQASPEEAVGIGRILQESKWRDAPLISAEFWGYAERRNDLSADQRCVFRALFSKDRPVGPYPEVDVCGTDVAQRVGIHPEQVEPEPPVDRSAEVAAARQAKEPATVALLVQRIDTFYELERSKNCVDRYELLSAADHEGFPNVDDWKYTCEELQRHRAILGWKVHKISIEDAKARVTLEFTDHDKVGWFRWRDVSEERDSYWVFEDGN